jgi:hypothetical protein
MSELRSTAKIAGIAFDPRLMISTVSSSVRRGSPILAPVVAIA